MEVKFKKCKICGNIVWSFNDKDIKCCDESMSDIVANSVDASFEKHIPIYEINGTKVDISVNHVMEENHYIMWIMMVSDNEIYYKEFTSQDTPVVTFDYIKNSTIYSYCNLHGLWVNKID